MMVLTTGCHLAKRRELPDDILRVRSMIYCVYIYVENVSTIYLFRKFHYADLLIALSEVPVRYISNIILTQLDSAFTC